MLYYIDNFNKIVFMFVFCFVFLYIISLLTDDDWIKHLNMDIHIV